MGIVFIYYKEAKIQVLDISNAKKSHNELLENGWKHKGTLNACVFLENLHNDCTPTDVVSKIVELGRS